MCFEELLCKADAGIFNPFLSFISIFFWVICYCLLMWQINLETYWTLPHHIVYRSGKRSESYRKWYRGWLIKVEVTPLQFVADAASSTVYENRSPLSEKKNQCDPVIKKLSPGNRLPLYFLLTYCILTGVTLITVNQGQRTDYICSHGSSPDVLLFPFPPPLCHAVSFSLSPPPSFFFSQTHSLLASCSL